MISMIIFCVACRVPTLPSLDEKRQLSSVDDLCLLIPEACASLANTRYCRCRDGFEANGERSSAISSRRTGVWRGGSRREGEDRQLPPRLEQLRDNQHFAEVERKHQQVSVCFDIEAQHILLYDQLLTEIF